MVLMRRYVPTCACCCRSVAGVCTGLATRKVSRVVAVGLGFTFIALQAMQYAGIIENVRYVYGAPTS